MSRFLTGIQSTGTPHLGNILGAIQPTVERSKDPNHTTFGFIANLHTLTAIKDPEIIKSNTYSVAATWIACGFDTDKNVFYRQSDIPQVTELMWYLDCFMNFQRLSLAHSFKDKSENLSEVNAGLFNYPVLMAADILLYDAEIVPVGKDQKQHLEFTRDLAQKINNSYGDVFTVPEIELNEKSMYVPGIDGRKMSKSYSNTINIFLPEKQLKKDVMKIITDDTPLEKPKNPDTCAVYNIYKLIANDQQISEMRSNYLGGNYGYGHVKLALFELLLENFQKERKVYNELINNTGQLDELLSIGNEKANIIANSTLKRVRTALGY